MDNLTDKNPANKYGFTPLHDAAEKGQLEVCKWYLENIYEIYPEDDDGLTPYRVAEMMGMEEIMNLFEDTTFLYTSIKIRVVDDI